MIAAYERRKRELVAQIADANKQHTARIDALRFEYEEAEKAVQLITNSLDDSKILLAEHMIYVSGRFASAGEDRISTLETAITYLCDGGAKLQHEYLGTKNYAHWHGQGVRHSYGMGPKHGSVIFEIGLHRPVRERAATPLLNDEEIDAAIYYLRNLERIQAAEASARTAAGAL